ncbi:MAG: RNA 2'-phosphotransferase [Prosthecobacter sp.]|uniref:RNA 2'-phosphotransferase n=1 Tax=Prosthecobacter sp. TaxID=1965333 RepID=UPI003903838C
MTLSQTTSASKLLSLVLRHEPTAAHVTLDSAGWVQVEALLAGCQRAGKPLSRADLEHIVVTNAKKRFEFSADGLSIRASQGHSVEVELEYVPMVPPPMLYHGTATRFLDSIHTQGLLKMQRNHVHLSAETKMTLEVGARHGKPALLTILAGEMHAAGHVFYRSTNGVWLVEHVPVSFIQFPDNLTFTPQEIGESREV